MRVEIAWVYRKVNTGHVYTGGVIDILQHTDAEGPGLLGERMRARGLTWRLVRCHRGDPVPATPGRALVVLGGPMGVYEAERHPHLADEMKLIRAAVAAGVPVLGICLGSQLLAAALGGQVMPGPARELGWLPVTSLADDPVLAPLGPVFTPLVWHGDVFTLPPGAVALARSEVTELQAFRLGSAHGLLFHLEADLAQITRMARAFPDELASVGLSEAELVAASERHVGELRPSAEQALDVWIGGWH